MPTECERSLTSPTGSATRTTIATTTAVTTTTTAGGVASAALIAAEISQSSNLNEELSQQQITSMMEGDMSTSQTSTTSNGSSCNGGARKTSITSPDPTAYVAKARVTRPTPPPPPYNPMQFVQIKPCNLYQTAQEQLKKAEEVKKIKEIRKEEPEDWQNNLDNWKSSRRKRVEHIIDRVVEVKKLELEEHDRTRRKSKTFSEMIEDRGDRVGRPGLNKLVSLAVYNEDESNDLSDLGIGTSSASGKSSLSEDYDNNSVMSDNAAELDKAISNSNHKPLTDSTTTREYISSPGYETSSSTAPASSPDPCEYTYEGAIQDYKQRVSRAASGLTSQALNKLTSTTTTSTISSTTTTTVSTQQQQHNSKESTPERAVKETSYPPRRGSKIEDRLIGFEVQSPSEECVSEKSKVDVPKIDISKRKEIFESQNSDSQKVSGNGNNGTSASASVPRVTLRDRFKPQESAEHVDLVAKKDVKRLSGDITSIKERLQSLEQQQNLVNGANGASKTTANKLVDISVPPLKERLSSLQNAVTKEDVRKPPVPLVDARQLEIMKSEAEKAKQTIKEEAVTVVSTISSTSSRIQQTVVQQQTKIEEAETDADTEVDRDDSGIHTADDIDGSEDRLNTEDIKKEQELKLNAAIEALAMEEKQFAEAANAVNQIEAEFEELSLGSVALPPLASSTSNGGISVAAAAAATPAATTAITNDHMEYSINEALELALAAIDKESSPHLIQIGECFPQPPTVPYSSNISNSSTSCCSAITAAAANNSSSSSSTTVTNETLVMVQQQHQTTEITLINKTDEEKCKNKHHSTQQQHQQLQEQDIEHPHNVDFNEKSEEEISKEPIYENVIAATAVTTVKSTANVNKKICVTTATTTLASYPEPQQQQQQQQHEPQIIPSMISSNQRQPQQQQQQPEQLLVKTKQNSNSNLNPNQNNLNDDLNQNLSNQLQISQINSYNNNGCQTTTTTATTTLINNKNNSNSNSNNNTINNNNNGNLVELTNAFANQTITTTAPADTNELTPATAATAATATASITTNNNNNHKNLNNDNSQLNATMLSDITTTTTTIPPIEQKPVKVQTTTLNITSTTNNNISGSSSSSSTTTNLPIEANIIEASTLLSNDPIEPYYQAPKSSEPYYDAPKHLKPVPVYENIEIFFNGSSLNGELSGDTPLHLQPPKEKPPPPPIDSPPLFDDVDSHTETNYSSSDNTYETLSRHQQNHHYHHQMQQHHIQQDHPSPPMKRMNSTKRIKKELRNKRSSFLGIEGSSLDDDDSYLELTVAPPPDMAQLLQEERRLEKQLYLKAGLCDSSDTGESRDSGVSENHSRQSSEHYTNSSEENEPHDDSTSPLTLQTQIALDSPPNDMMYQNDGLLAVAPTPLLQTVKGNSAESWTESATVAAAATQSLTEATATANAKIMSIEEKIREQEEVLRVERELLQLEQEELKRQRENLMLRENMARRELQHGAKMLMSANRRSLQDLNGLGAMTVAAGGGNVNIEGTMMQPNNMEIYHMSQINGYVPGQVPHQHYQPQPQHAQPQQHQQIYANIPNLQQQYYQMDTDYRKSMSDINEFSKRMMQPPMPPSKPMRATQMSTASRLINGTADLDPSSEFTTRQRHPLNSQQFGGSLVKIATPPTAAPRGGAPHIYSNFHHQSAQNLNTSSGNLSQAHVANANAAAAAANQSLYPGNMSRNTLHALSATPKPKYTDGWVQVQQRKSYDTNLANDPAWVSAYQQKRKSMPDTYHNYNNNNSSSNHWLVQEAEQRRLAEQQQRRVQTTTSAPVHVASKLTNGGSGNNIMITTSSSSTNGKPLPDSIIQTLTERVQSKGIGDRKRNNLDKSPLHAASQYHQYSKQQHQVPTSNPVHHQTHVAIQQQQSSSSMVTTHRHQHSTSASMTTSSSNNGQLINTTSSASSISTSQDKVLSVSGKKKCSHCGDELGRGAAMIIESLLLFYHINCFKCCVCHVQLGDGLNGTDVRVRNHKLHCQNCYSSDDGIKFSCV